MTRSIHFRNTWLVTSRLVWLALLVLLLALSFLHATRYDPKRAHAIAFSTDSKEVLVFRGAHLFPRPHLDESTAEIQTWDVASQRLVRTQVTGHGHIQASGNGRHLFDLSRDWKLRLLNRNTVQPLGEWQLPSNRGDQIMIVPVSDRLVFATYIAFDRTVSTRCFRLDDDRARVLFERINCGAILSRDGRRLFVSLRENAANTESKTEVFQIVDDALIAMPELSMSGRVIDVNSDGNIVFFYANGTTYLRNLQSGTEKRWSPAAQCYLLFAGQGPLLHCLYLPGTLATYDSETGNLVNQRQLVGLSSQLTQLATSPDGTRIAGMTDEYQTRVWDIATGQLVARFPDHRLLTYGLIVGYSIWCLVWLALTVVLSSPRPWLNVLLLNILPLTVFVSHAATRPRWEIHPVIVALSLALLTALLGLLCVWWIHGGLRWSLRLAGMVAGLAVLAAVLLAPGHGSDGGVWNTMLGAVSFILVLALLLKSLHWRRMSIAPGLETATSSPDSITARWQIPLIDLLVMTAAIALLLGVMRFAAPSLRELDFLIYVTLHGVALAVSIFLAILAALSPGKFWLRLALACVIVPVGASIPLVYLAMSGPDPLWWCVTLHSLAAADVLLSLCIFRWQGYRIVRSDSLRGGAAAA